MLTYINKVHIQPDIKNKIKLLQEEEKISCLDMAVSTQTAKIKEKNLKSFP
jgi:hypothetical protein